MTFLQRIRIPLFGALALALLAALAAGPQARAELVATDRVVEQAGPGEARGKVRDFLLRKDVQAEMEALGIAPEEARARVSALSRSELAEIAGRLDALPAGQDVSTNVLIAILLILLVLLLI